MNSILSRFSLRTFFQAVSLLLVVSWARIALAGALEQTIKWVAPAVDFIPLNEPTPVAATSSSGLPVTIRVEHGPGVIVNGQLVANGPGAIWIKAEQAGNETYTPSSTTRAFNLRQAAVSLVRQYADSAPILDSALDTSLLYAASGTNGLRIF